jgi:phosphoserine phosphatase
MTFSDTATQAQPSIPVTAFASNNGNWFPENLAQINAGLDAIAAAPVSPAPVAVFDFDNTCIFRDVGQAVCRFQALHLRYRLTPQQFAAILPQSGGQLAGRPMMAITTLLLESYQVLYPLLIGGKQEEASLLPAGRLFPILLLWFIAQARQDAQLGPRYVLPFMGKLLAGHSVQELRQLAVEVVREVGSEPLREAILSLEAPAPIGCIRFHYLMGLHAYPEMLSLMHSLAERGIERYVISASSEWLVEGAAEWLGFPIAADCIFGIRGRLDADERLTIADPLAYPISYREGKTEIIRNWIVGRPVLVAGDADTDFEMLTLPDVTIRILINRQQCGLISRLYQDPRVLLQGLDCCSGRFRPSRESVGL